MASPVSRLRRWFALGAILMITTVAGMYFYARWSVRKAVHDLPAKMGLDIQQTAEGFSISKSIEGRTQFTVSASKAVQFKDGGRADLHNVKIVIYGKDAGRFDQVAADDFEYDPVSGNVTAKGTVLIDLEANPEGMRHSDQTPPAQRRTPIHLETDGLVFNKNTGDASSAGKVVFQTPQASGSAVGIEYVAKTGTMNLLSAVAMTVNRPQPVHLNADHGVITKQPHQVVLTTVHMTREQQEARSDHATFFLREDDTVDHILAEGDVETVLHGRSSSNSNSETRERSDHAELFLTGARNLLTTAILTGNVQLASLGAQPADAAAGRATLHFAGRQMLKTVHAEDGVRLTQKSSRTGTLVAAAAPVIFRVIFRVVLRTLVDPGEGRHAGCRNDRTSDGLYRERRPPAGACRDQRTAADRDHATGRKSEDGGYSRQVHGEIHGEQSPGDAAWRTGREDCQQLDPSK